MRQSPSPCHGIAEGRSAGICPRPPSPSPSRGSAPPLGRWKAGQPAERPGERIVKKLVPPPQKQPLVRMGLQTGNQYRLGQSHELGTPAGPTRSVPSVKVLPETRPRGESVVVERFIVPLHDHVVARGSIARFDPERGEPGVRIALQEGVGEQMARATRKEDAVGESPTPNGIALGARITKNVQPSTSGACGGISARGAVSSRADRGVRLRTVHGARCCGS